MIDRGSDLISLVRRLSSIGEQDIANQINHIRERNHQFVFDGSEGGISLLVSMEDSP